jgi:hypothetical protein
MYWHAVDIEWATAHSARWLNTGLLKPASLGTMLITKTVVPNGR